jgi:hypothetical protein
MLSAHALALVSAELSSVVGVVAVVTVIFCGVVVEALPTG